MSPRQAAPDLPGLRQSLGLELDNPVVSPADRARLRGGYYTPPRVAALLARWAVRSPDAKVLEPSCGDGEIVGHAADRLADEGAITAVELFAEEAAKARTRGGSSCRVVCGDFFAWYLMQRPDGWFDAVVGNPPFIRFQNFPEDHRDAAFALMRSEGLRPSRLTNAWVPFVVASTRALRPGGRLALVLPAELLQVTYAAELREYLVRKYRRLVIVTFKQLLFPGIQQETVLLFGIRGDSGGARIKWLELDGASDIGEIDQLASQNGVAADLDHAREKWTQFYLSPTELTLIRGIEEDQRFTTLGALASVDVGVVTGRNELFVMTLSEAKSRALLPWCQPLVGRSSQIPGLVLTRADWERQRDEDGRCFLLQLGNRKRSALAAAALAYVEQGEHKGFHRGFKLRVRGPVWWNVPSVWTSDTFLLRQIHDGPRIVVNEAGAICTDTIHRVRVNSGTNPYSLAAASVTSLAFAFAEIRGRSYGGGVLELEPTEAESLPWIADDRCSHFEKVERWSRALRGADLLEKADGLVLRGAGMTSGDATTLRQIWHRLYTRRLSRKPFVTSQDDAGKGPAYSDIASLGRTRAGRARAVASAAGRGSTASL